MTNALLVGAALAALSLSACASSTNPPCMLDAGQNESPCSKTWSDARALCTPPTSCATLGFRCAYPGAGDLNGNCLATAVLLCEAVDVGQNQWFCAQ